LASENNFPAREEGALNDRERHYTVLELAANWNLSSDTIRDLFKEEQDVIVIHNPKRGCRGYKTLRIPKFVAERVYERLKNKPHRSPHRGAR